MPFTDSGFLLVFLPTVLGLYFVAASLVGRSSTSKHRRFGLANAVVALGSVVFLAAGSQTYASVIATATALLFGFGWVIRHRAVGAVPELGFAFGLTGVLLLYGLYTSANPVVSSLDGWLARFTEHRFSVPGLLVPLGLSVFVCHAVSFIVDVYRRDAVVHTNPAHAAMYLLGFPFMVAGPIIRYRDISQHLATRQIGMASFAYGVRRFTIGLGKVALIAQIVAVPADVAFAATVDTLGLVPAWMGLICFSFQVYFDLSGYADMALGIGRMLGFRLPENFNAPYTADSFHEFWRRWNLSLTTWCDTYLALSIDPKPDTTGRYAASLVGLFLVISLWHGLSWGVLAWAGVHALFVAFERTRWGMIVARFPAPARHAYVLVFVAASWVFFRAETLADALHFFQALVGFGASGLEALALPLTGMVWTALVIGVLAILPVLPTVSRWSVTLDALATALQMVMTTAAMFIWVRILRQRRDESR